MLAEIMVCLETYDNGKLCPGGGLCLGGLCPGEIPLDRDPPFLYGKERAVRIPLKCILV